MWDRMTRALDFCFGKVPGQKRTTCQAGGVFARSMGPPKCTAHLNSISSSQRQISLIHRRLLTSETKERPSILATEEGPRLWKGIAVWEYTCIDSFSPPPSESILSSFEFETNQSRAKKNSPCAFPYSWYKPLDY